MHLEIITPDKKIYTGNVTSVQLPGVDGYFGLQNNHAAMISTLKAGEIKVIENAEAPISFEVKGGVMEVNNNTIIVLAEQ